MSEKNLTKVTCLFFCDILQYLLQNMYLQSCSSLFKPVVVVDLQIQCPLFDWKTETLRQTVQFVSKHGDKRLLWR